MTTYEELKAAVRMSRGWHARIARESGCNRRTLRGIANSDAYDPRISEVELIRNWFAEHGVPKAHPCSKAGREQRA